jgi:hypothetical protein
MFSPILVEDYYDSDSLDPHADLKAKCPVRGCARAPVEYNRLRLCLTHGLELHPSSETFVYFNGGTDEDKTRARLRNILWDKDFMKHHVLDSPHKAETHRLGYENSEDALSWNVFVALRDAGKLPAAAQCLAPGHQVRGNSVPELYLWGNKIDIEAGSFKPFRHLEQARSYFEPGVQKYLTEPDIMLVTNELIICIEAKFTSGNPLAQPKTPVSSDDREKPKDRDGLIEKYARRWPDSCRYLDHNALKTVPLHSQLFRNIIFASWMAEQTDRRWHVVNLASSAQWRKRRNASAQEKNYDFDDPSPVIKQYLKPQFKDHFSFCTWEALHETIIRSGGLVHLSTYLEKKTAHLEPAFDLYHGGMCTPRPAP